MKCQRCSSERIVKISGKTSDMCSAQIGKAEHDGYVPRDIGIGGGDYLGFKYCLDCGQMQGTFPLPTCQLEQFEDELE